MNVNLNDKNKDKTDKKDKANKSDKTDKTESKKAFWLMRFFSGDIMSIGVITFLAVIMSLSLIIYEMQQSIDTSVYAERRVLLGNLTESSADIVSDNVNYGQSIVDMFADNAMVDVPNHDSIDNYFKELNARGCYEDYILFFVDSNGKYYSSDGVNGKITDMTYYTGTSDDKLSYISSIPHLGSEKAYLVIRNRLSQYISVMSDNGNVELMYCGILFDIDNINYTVSQEFGGTTNTFIYDISNGSMLYKNFGIKLLIDGYNVYPKFEKSTILFGENSEDLINSCKNGESVVVSLEIEGEEYFFCSAPIEFNDWAIAFIVQGSYLDEISGNAFGDVIVSVSIIALLLSAVVVFTISAVYKNSVAEKSLKEITALNIELEKATNAKTEFLSNMSHDIRTPINGIMGMTAIAKGVSGNPAKTAECLNKIDGVSNHLLSLINDVLDMSRIEQGRTEISANPIDMRVIFDNCCSIIRGQMSGRSLNLIPELNCIHTNLIGDDLHLRQIFINILGNAVKFTKDGGSIWFRCDEIETTETTAVLRFEFEDTGIGMKPEFLPKVFESFTQDEGGARSVYKGTGLGMAITKHLTELMGGKVSVESEFGKGSKFTVVIPFVINTGAQESEENTAVDGNIEGVKVLLVEDNEINTEVAEELLGDVGAIITTAADGKQALDLFSSSSVGTFDVILMDIMMPVMNGLESTKAIRALDREDAKTIPIIAMTANAFETDIQATRDAGMNAHLSKPIIISEVIKTIAYYVNRK